MNLLAETSVRKKTSRQEVSSYDIQFELLVKSLN